jgi:flagellar basal-body rod modification protein FlgD
MQVNATDSNSVAPAAERVPIQTMGQNDFLKLLATQMSSQDPLKPMTDTSFVAQMVQFSMMEQNQGMQKDLAKLSSDQQLGQANGLLGKTVSFQSDSGTLSSGVVSAIKIEDGIPELIVDGQPHSLSDIQTIAPTQLGN